MKNTEKKIAIAIILFLLASGVFIGFWELTVPETKSFTPHYFFYQGISSKIYLSSETSSYLTANKTYFSANGQEVAKGTQLFIIKITLRNDYSPDNPPPSIGTPISPIDGTAYIALNSAIFNQGRKITAINVSPTDFSTPSPDETGIVLASGQTVEVNIYLATSHTDVTSFDISPMFISDSIPS